jgi:hypothetical protein
MPRMLALVLVLSVLWLTLTPFVSWAAQAAEKHDCRQERPKGSYYCEHGPLAGKRFASRKAMVEALKNSFAAEVARKNGKASTGTRANVKTSAK